MWPPLRRAMLVRLVALSGRAVMNTARPACALLALLLAGCATYRTPGAGLNLGDFSRADADIGEVMKRQPAAQNGRARFFIGQLNVVR